MHDIDPTVSKEQLLLDIRAAAQSAPHFPGMPLIAFATLLVKVGGEAGETVDDLKAHITELNRRNGVLQWWVIALAVVALVATVVQTVVAVASYRH